ncbi:actin-1-like [Convolutriloba macropyga]|uniref:actin-1-like n=1 Tax=Convolutriloba macropyga TaxID=536237 RepID=UPI003F523EB2
MCAAVVIDCGSGLVKAGYAGEGLPRSVFPDVVGQPKSMFGNMKDYPYVGDEAIAKRGVLALKYPVSQGTISNFDQMEAVWEHTFSNELRISPSDHPLMLTNFSTAPVALSEKMTQIMFEKFNCPALYLGKQAEMSMFGVGKSTGVVVDSGFGVTTVVPVVDNKVVKEASVRLLMAGCDLSDYMAKLLSKSGYHLTTSAERDLVTDIKEKFCYVSLNYESESASPKSYTLPDDSQLTVTSERFRCPEALFKPSMAEIGSIGLHKAVMEAVKASSSSVQDDLLANIVVAGGSSSFPGFAARLQKEVAALTNMNVSVCDDANKKYSVFHGASKFAAQSNFASQLAVSKNEYNEHGASIVNTRC